VVDSRFRTCQLIMAAQALTRHEAREALPTATGSAVHHAQDREAGRGRIPNPTPADLDKIGTVNFQRQGPIGKLGTSTRMCLLSALAQPGNRVTWRIRAI
jgi:hypothetical protein